MTEGSIDRKKKPELVIIDFKKSAKTQVPGPYAGGNGGGEGGRGCERTS